MHVHCIYSVVQPLSSLKCCIEGMAPCLIAIQEMKLMTLTTLCCMRALGGVGGSSTNLGHIGNVM